MNIAPIIVTYKTKESSLINLKRQLIKSKIMTAPVVIGNTVNNTGFGAGVNKGVKKALKNNPDTFLILNPDINIEKLDLPEVQRSAKALDIFGGEMKQAGTTYYGGTIDKLSMAGGLITNKPSCRIVNTSFVSGSMMFIKKQVVEKIGLFKKDYFLYYEDVEYCHRAKNNGFKVGINTNIKYTHFEESKKSISKEYYLNRNRLYFIKEYAKPKQLIYNIIKTPLNLLQYKLHKNNINRLKEAAYLDFFRGKKYETDIKKILN
jgi:GT2 family glycosyltransferase